MNTKKATLVDFLTRLGSFEFEILSLIACTPINAYMHKGKISNHIHRSQLKSEIHVSKGLNVKTSANIV
jgi:hypothetical protein